MRRALGQNQLSIDFGAALQATDFDGDAIPLTGKVTVNVTDDVPVLTNAAAVVLTVDEDDIETAGSTGSAPDDGNVPDGSFTGPGGVDTQGPANATSGSLAGLVVASGADDPLTFGFVSEATVRALLTAQSLTSEGAVAELRCGRRHALRLCQRRRSRRPDLRSRARTAWCSSSRSNPATGAFTFSLHDQLDHAPGAGPEPAFDRLRLGAAGDRLRRRRHPADRQGHRQRHRRRAGADECAGGCADGRRGRHRDGRLDGFGARRRQCAGRFLHRPWRGRHAGSCECDERLACGSGGCVGRRRSADLRLRVGSHGACVADGAEPDVGRRGAELRCGRQHALRLCQCRRSRRPDL